MDHNKVKAAFYRLLLALILLAVALKGYDLTGQVHDSDVLGGTWVPAWHTIALVEKVDDPGDPTGFHWQSEGHNFLAGYHLLKYEQGGVSLTDKGNCRAYMMIDSKIAMVDLTAWFNTLDPSCPVW